MKGEVRGELPEQANYITANMLLNSIKQYYTVLNSINGSIKPQQSQQRVRPTETPTTAVLTTTIQTTAIAIPTEVINRRP